MKSYDLNYIKEPLGIAVMSLRGDLSDMVENGTFQDLKLIKAHWALAARKFKTDLTRANTKKRSGIIKDSEKQIIEIWLKLAEVSFDTLPRY